MTGHGEKWTRKQEEAILALLAQPTIPEAAKACRLSPSTLLRWLKTAEFQQRYKEARRQVVEQALARLQSDCSAAARVLREVADDGAAPASSRVAAARAIIDTAIKAVELQDLAARIEELERRAKG